MEGVDELARALDNAARDLPRESSIAINGTRTQVVKGMSKQIREELAVKAKDLKTTLKARKRATKSSLNASVQLDHSSRLSLRAFGSRQTRKGVSYLTHKGRGRQIVPGGFMGPKPGVKAPRLGGHAYKRQGTARKPIVRLHGASAWGSYTKNNMQPRTVREGEHALEKQIERRIRFNVLKKQGLI